MSFKSRLKGFLYDCLWHLVLKENTLKKNTKDKVFTHFGGQNKEVAKWRFGDSRVCSNSILLDAKILFLFLTRKNFVLSAEKS